MFISFHEAGKRSLNLDWSTRYDICLGVARGLAYLHEESRLRIVHRDVKASNILLDSDLIPKISDFGLAKLYDDKKTHISTRVAGTIGYLAPEYAMRGHLTEKADVFAFGVVALEVVSGRPNCDSTLEEEKIYLLEWAWHLHENNCEVDLVDTTLSEINEEEMKRVIGVSLLCTQASPMLRPSMSRAVAMLSGDIEVSTVTSRPGYLTDWKFDDVTGLVGDSVAKGTDTNYFNSSASTSMVGDTENSPIINPSKPMLHETINEGNTSLNLDWSTRYDICLGVARGLAYLHEESRLRIVHRDVKASNILLDSNLIPKISDFGLAKLYDDKKTHISTRVAGTIGYLAPEYAMRGHLTEKADVFAFGVVALEVVSGRSNCDSTLEEEKIYLLEWAWHLHENNCEADLVDTTLSDINEEEMKRVIGVSLLCTQASPLLRPSMSRVVAMLSGDIEVSTVTSRPGYLTDWKFDDSTGLVSDFVAKGADTSYINSSSSTSIVGNAENSPMICPSQPMLHETVDEGR
ncbi:hypothetical protein CJ030_MR4G016062 [Morella rubra]|uniref:Protein kinase domain-containing protein n=1 Tax=Morella rubra TaxID=262757 RepID=A0A6A1VW04_9ROSI|nr:hypothetical protein CJ030_MR4G016062 [Morella rubra]